MSPGSGAGQCRGKCRYALALIACKPELFPSGLTRAGPESARQAVRDGRGDPLKDVLACPGTLLADGAGDPELSGLEHALLFKKLPRPAHWASEKHSVVVVDPHGPETT